MNQNGFTHESQSAKSIEWYTPKWIFDSLGVTFDMDVCTKVGGVDYIPATKHLSLKDDGLKTEWEGSVWCNPPYGKDTKIWLEKFKKHRNGIALVFARTDTKWFHDIAKDVDAILFIEKRVQFVDALNATNKGGSTSGSMLLAYGKKNLEALKNIKGFLVINKENT